MNKILFIALLICSNFALGQPENFTQDNNQVTWSKVFETTKTKEKIKIREKLLRKENHDYQNVKY